jgi:hypothetical protein
MGYNSVMGYKTYERDRYGRLLVYPSLHPPKAKGFCRKFFGRLLRSVIRKS